MWFIIYAYANIIITGINFLAFTIQKLIAYSIQDCQEEYLKNIENIYFLLES